MQTAYYFGVFDPVHKAHVAVAEAAARQFNIEHLVWVPAYLPPHKATAAASFKHRVAMLKLVCSSHTGWEVSDIEAKLPAPTYSVNTLRALIPSFDQLPAGSVPFIMGEDSLNSLDTWFEADTLREKLHILLAPRDSDIPSPINTAELTISRIEMPKLDISSSEIRLGERLLDVPPPVADYITRNNLYNA